jgi:hypothetical protein
MALTKESALFYWASHHDQPVVPPGLDATFIRASDAWFHDRSGSLRKAIPGAPRYEWHEINGILRPCYVSEPGRTNLVGYNETWAQWTAVGAGTPVTAGQRDPAGGTNAVLVNDSDATSGFFSYASRALVSATFATNYVTAYVKQGTADGTTVALSDGTSSAWMVITWGADGSIASTSLQQNGTAVAAHGWKQYIGGGWWRVGYRATGFVTGGTHTIYLYGARTDVATSTGTTLWFRPQVEGNVNHGSSSILNAAATATSRAADVLYWPVNIPAQPVCTYWRGKIGAEGGQLLAGRLFGLHANNGSTNPRALLYCSAATTLGSFISNVASASQTRTVAVNAANLPPWSDVEMCGIAHASGSSLAVAVNGAHMANSASVSGVAIDGTWNFVLLGHEANGTQALARHAEAKAVRWADTEASLLANGTAAQAQAALEEMREFMLGAGGYEV